MNKYTAIDMVSTVRQCQYNHALKSNSRSSSDLHFSLKNDNAHCKPVFVMIELNIMHREAVYHFVLGVYLL